MNIVVLDGHCLNPGDLSWEGFEALGKLKVYDRTDPQEVDARIEGADIVLTNKTPIRKAHLLKARDLRYIGVLATGYDVIDVADAAALGVTVTNVPTYGTDSVAQTVFALLLELIHRTAAHSDLVKNGGWSEEWSMSLSPFMELAGKKMGIFGYGRIGRAVAQIARAFGMQIVVPERGKEEKNVTRLPLDDFFREADVVSLHTPLTDANRGIIDKRILGLMKPSAYLINTARGALIVEEDLAEALEEGMIAGAGLDVLMVEPNTHSPLLLSKHVVLSPHRAWSAFEARERLMRMAVENLTSWLDGKPIHVV